jgi:4-hydroxybenzoate polyprenyltransferase
MSTPLTGEEEPADRAPPLAPPQPPRHGPWVIATAAIEGMRPYQWLKNGLVFVPFMEARRLGEAGHLFMATAIFLAFNFCASAIYLINDLKDAQADRLHPHKRTRPIASGRLPRSVAVALVPAILIGGLRIAMTVDVRVAGVLLFYVVLMVMYSMLLKAVVLLDAFILAGGYALRIAAGSVAVDSRPAPQLLAFFVFVFFSLAMVKRYAELSLLRHAGMESAPARSYGVQDSELVLVLGGSSGMLSVLILALFLNDEHLGQTYARSAAGWGAAVVLLYWISHMWLTAHRGKMTDDPLVFAVKDRVSLVLITLTIAAAWFAL